MGPRAKEIGRQIRQYLLLIGRHGTTCQGNRFKLNDLIIYLYFVKAEKCSGRDISISQGQVSTSGIPQYAVEIMNTCLSDCAPLDVHLHCGMFSSANLINPSLFRRLGNDDCLVNGGRALKPGQIIRFVYSTTFKFPLAFKSAKFC